MFCIRSCMLRNRSLKSPWFWEDYIGTRRTTTVTCTYYVIGYIWCPLTSTIALSGYCEDYQDSVAYFMRWQKNRPSHWPLFWRRPYWRFCRQWKRLLSRWRRVRTVGSGCRSDNQQSACSGVEAKFRSRHDDGWHGEEEGGSALGRQDRVFLGEWHCTTICQQDDDKDDNNETSDDKRKTTRRQRQDDDKRTRTRQKRWDDDKWSAFHD